jgi:DNA invertase Pin-like site-specific DNA recombinase
MPESTLQLKIRPEHLEKLAFIYVRQSTRNGVLHNVVGGRRQREEVESLALQLGWSNENIIIVDYDQAVSGSSTQGRYGYVDMLSAIAEGRVGAVFSLESTRLGRDSADWHYLIKACDLNGTLIIDPEGVYDASDSNDSTLMKVKALMSEMELRWITNRLLGAKRELAKKGELRTFVPVGYTYDADRKLQFHSDDSVREAVQVLFSCFERIGSALGVVRHFAQKNLKFPTQVRGGPRAGEFDWEALRASRVCAVLGNPTYAGTYVWGRSKTKKKLVQTPGGMPEVKKCSVSLPRENWQFVIYDHHPGYITWSQYLINQQRLDSNRCLPGMARQGSAKAGSALLQGLALCGKCGHKMSIYYAAYRPVAYYKCRHDEIEFAGEVCQTIPGGTVEAAVAKVFLEAVAPMQLKLSLRACQRAEAGSHNESLQWNVRLKRATGSVTRAKERLLFVDYTNKSAFDCAQEDLKRCEEQLASLKLEQATSCGPKSKKLNPIEIKLVHALTKDLPHIWAAQTTDFVAKKNLLRCLIQDVTLLKTDSIVRVAIRWKSSASTTLEVQLPGRAASLRTATDVIDLIRALAPNHTSQEIADLFNEAGIVNARGGTFTKKRVKRLRERYKIKFRNLNWRKQVKDRRYTVEVVAKLLELQPETVHDWCRQGRLEATRRGWGSAWTIKLKPGEISKLRSNRRSRTRLRANDRAETSMPTSSNRSNAVAV